MKFPWLTIWLVTLLILGSVMARAETTNGLQVTIELRDGSRVVGQSTDDNLDFQSDILGQFRLPMASIRSIRFQPGTNACDVAASNGDQLKLSLLTRGIRLKTTFGDVTLPAESMSHLVTDEAGRAGAVPEGLVARWSAEGNANDSVGSCNGRLMNGAGFGPGKFGMGFDLNDSDENGGNGYVLIPASAQLDVAAGSGFTIEGWIKPATVSREMLIAEFERELGTSIGSDVGVDFAIQSINGMGGWCLYAHIPGPGSGGTLFSPPGMIRAGVWQHVALTYDRASGTAALYLNGIVVAQENIGNIPSFGSYPYFVLGAKTIYGSVENPRSAFAGGLDEFGFYNRALSAAEIQEAARAASGGAAVR